MKRFIAIILTAVLLLSSLAGCGGSETVTKNVHVEGSIFGGKSDDSIAAELKFNPDWITKGDNNKYNKDLAAFAALLSADSYFREKDLAKGTQNRVLVDESNAEEYDFTSLLRELGFTDTKHIESFKEKEYSADQNDSVTMNMGYMKSGKNGIYVVAIRGCFSSGEWVSAFDLGSDSENYNALTGEHPEWKNTDVFKGLDVAAARAMEFINEFIAEHEGEADKNYILVTGHSRGGSIAQIAGARLAGDSAVNSVTYTFNSLPVTSSSTAEECPAVFNITDDGDFFGHLFAFGSEPLYRYGTTLDLNAADSGEALAEIASLKGRDDYTALTAEQIAEYTELFGAHFTDRAALYEEKVFYRSIDTADPKDVDAEVDRLNSIISAETGLGLEGLASACLPSDHTISVEYCDAAQIQCIGKVLTYGASAAEAAKDLFSADTEFCAIIDFITSHFAEISGGHLLVDTYALTQFVE